MSGNGRDEPVAMPAQPVVVAQMVLNPDQQTMTIVPGPMVAEPILFYLDLAEIAAHKARELRIAEYAKAESRKKPQILRPTSWPSDLKGSPEQ